MNISWYMNPRQHWNGFACSYAWRNHVFCILTRAFYHSFLYFYQVLYWITSFYIKIFYGFIFDFSFYCISQLLFLLAVSWFLCHYWELSILGNGYWDKGPYISRNIVFCFLCVRAHPRGGSAQTSPTDTPANSRRGRQLPQLPAKGTLERSTFTFLFCSSPFDLRCLMLMLRCVLGLDCKGSDCEKV